MKITSAPTSVIPCMDETAPVHVLKNEPMFFNASLDFAYDNGGPITKRWVAEITRRYPTTEMVVDTRVHMLMKNWFPCIPGWHHDDVPRSGRDGQPNYISPEYRSQHIMTLINGHICPTEFAMGQIELEIPTKGIIYKQWHLEVEEALADGRLGKWYAPSGALIHFNDRAFHQGNRAREDGWRWFGRASWNTERKPTNEIRRQVQVYLEYPMEGW